MISKEQYGLWKHEPVTKWFFEYLAEKQLYMKGVALDMWIDGNDPSQAVRGQIIELQELMTLPFEAIEAFYQEKETNAGESEG